MFAVVSGRSLPGWRHKWLIVRCSLAHRLMHLRASPHEVALGCAVGVFVSITPLLGAQTLIAALLAGFFRANVPTAVLGTFFGNPVSWPIIWTSTYAMGLQIIRPDGGLGAGDLEQNVMLLWTALLERSPELLNATGALLWPLLLPMLAGSLPLVESMFDIVTDISLLEMSDVSHPLLQELVRGQQRTSAAAQVPPRVAARRRDGDAQGDGEAA